MTNDVCYLQVMRFYPAVGIDPWYHTLLIVGQYCPCSLVVLFGPFAARKFHRGNLGVVRGRRSLLSCRAVDRSLVVCEQIKGPVAPVAT